MEKDTKGLYTLGISDLKNIEAGDVLTNVMNKLREFSSAGDIEGLKNYMKQMEEFLGEPLADELKSALSKRGPLEEGEDLREQMLVTMYGAKVKSDDANMARIFKPTGIDFYEEPHFSFQEGEESYRKDFKGGNLIARMIEVLRDDVRCLDFMVTDIDVMREVKGLKEVIVKAEKELGKISIGTSTNGKDLLVILGSYKFRDRGYRDGLATILEGQFRDSDLDYRTLDKVMNSFKGAMKDSREITDICNKAISEFPGVNDCKKTKRMKLGE